MRAPSSGGRSPGARQRARELVAALGHLTVAPTRRDVPPGPTVGVWTSAWFGPVGALIGLVAGGVLYLTEPRLGTGVAAVAGVLVLVAVSGARPAGALAAAAEAVADAPRAPGRSRPSAAVGPTVGVLALVFYALLLVAVLGSVPRRAALETLIAAGALSRAVLVPAARGLRADGDTFLPTSFAATSTSLVAAVVVAYAALGPARAASAMVAAAVACAVGAALVRRPGLGDATRTIGAVIALAEVAVCVAVLAGR